MAKKKVTFTIDEDTVELFNKITKLNSINKSQWVENKINSYLKEEIKKMREDS